jgi:hypothetical protein
LTLENKKNIKTKKKKFNEINKKYMTSSKNGGGELRV